MKLLLTEKFNGENQILFFFRILPLKLVGLLCGLVIELSFSLSLSLTNGDFEQLPKIN